MYRLCALAQNIRIIVHGVCSKSRESINYDEYLDGGIPDTLLEGLGFYANSGDAEVTSDQEDVPDEMPEVQDERPVAVPMQSQTRTHSANAGKLPFCQIRN